MCNHVVVSTLIRKHKDGSQTVKQVCLVCDKVLNEKNIEKGSEIDDIIKDNKKR